MSNRTASARAWRVVPAVAAGILLAVAALSPGCKGVEVQTLQPVAEPTPGNIGDPCLNPDELYPSVSGHRVNETVLLKPFNACSTGICLINHVQGRATCPLGQDAPTICAGPNDTSCGSGLSCVAAGQNGPTCYFTSEDGGAPVLDASDCLSGVCNPVRNTCQCTSDAHCPQGTACDPVTQECTRYVCHRPGECQSADATDAENAGKSCCAGEADVPVAVEVCGQCEKGSGRNAGEDIYCSCRCGPADGEPPGDAEYCTCPSGFECSQRPPGAGFDNPEFSGQYCIKQGTAYTDPGQCGSVSGHFSSSCDGTPAN